MKNKGLYILLVVLGAAIFTSSCKKFNELNNDPKNPSEADAGLLLAYAEKELAFHYNNSNPNRNVSRLLAQYWSQVTYTNESRYVLETRSVNDNNWDILYRNVLSNLNAARLNITAVDKDIRANQEAIITVLEVYTFQLMVDIYGPLPYSEALKGEDNPNPQYDSAEDIYADLLKRIDGAIDDLSEVASFGPQDIIYGGDGTKWKKFANSIKLRLAIRVLDSGLEDDAKKAIKEAASEVFTSNADNAQFPFRDGSQNGNPLFAELVLSGRKDYAPTKTLVDIMNGLEDPRRPFYMTMKDDKYIGLEYGKKAASLYADYSHVSDKMKKATFPGALLEYSQIAFMLAEAAEKGIDVGGTAEEHYNNAVTASITLWGGDAKSVEDYLKQSEVAYSTAEDGDKIKAIAMQKWIAQYNHGYEGWIEWRRLDYPKLMAPEEMTEKDIPRRQKYPINEASLNGANYKDGVKMLDGKDAYSTKIFWDKK